MKCVALLIIIHLMNNYRRILLLLPFILACTELPQDNKEDDTPPEPPVIEEPVEVHFKGSDGQALSSLTIPSSGEPVTVTLESTGRWYLQTSSSWLQATPDSGKEGNMEISISSDKPYIQDNERIATLEAVPFGGKGESVTLSVSQEAFVKANMFTIPPDPAYTLPRGGSAQVSFHSDEAWTLQSTVPWLKITPDSGSAGDFVLQFTTEENKYSNDRIAIIRSTTPSGTKEDYILQHANVFARRHIRTANVQNDFVVRYSSGISLSEIIILIPYPETNEYQDITNSQFSGAELKTSDTGVNYLMCHNTSGFPKSGEAFISHSYTVDYYTLNTDFSKITERNLPYDTESPQYKRYTDICYGINGDDKSFIMIDPTDPRIVAWADQLWEEAKGDRIDYARICHKWVADNIEYGIYDGDNTIDEIIQRMSGDCGNMHSLWMSLLRCKGIPARPIVMAAPQNQWNDEIESHVRGEFYIPGYGWIPLDINNLQNGENNFGKFPDQNFIVMNRDFSIDVKAGYKTYNCSLLQVVWWLVWCGGHGDLDGEVIFKEE